MALVEAVAGELVDQVEQFVGLGLGDLVVLAQPSTKVARWASISDLIFLPIARRSRSALAERIASEDLRRLHHLFLVDEDPVGLLEDAFEQRVRIFDRLLAVLAAAEHRDVVHRTRTIERVRAR